MVGLRPKEDLVFGKPCPLPRNQLPTNRDIGKAVAFEKVKKKDEDDKVTNSNNDIFKEVAGEVKEIYNHASVPTINLKCVTEKIGRLWVKRREKLKDKDGDRKKHGKKKIKLKNIIDDLFDVVKAEEVPDIEKEFVQDQRSERKMYIGGLDEAVTKENKEKQKIAERRMIRLAAEQERRKKFLEDENKKRAEIEAAKVTEFEEEKSVIDVLETRDSVENSEDDDCEEAKRDKMKCEEENVRKRRKLMKVNEDALEKVVETVERAGISDNMACQIINDVKVALGVITKDDQSQVLYMEKMRKMKLKLRKKKIEDKKGKKVRGVMFDERKDFTKSLGENVNQFEVVKKENCSIVIFEEPEKKVVEEEVIVEAINDE